MMTAKLKKNIKIAFRKKMKAIFPDHTISDMDKLTDFGNEPEAEIYAMRRGHIVFLVYTKDEEVLTIKRINMLE